MAERTHFTYLSLAVGSLVVAAGWTLAGVYAFRGDFVPVAIGYLVFAIGYKICWYGTHTINSFSELRRLLRNGGQKLFSHVKADLKNYLLLGIGVVAAGYGTTLFAQIILGEEMIIQVINAGIISFIGYMVSHEGVNEVLL